MKTNTTRSARNLFTALAVATTALTLTACTTTLPQSQQSVAEQRQDINTRADAAVKRLHEVAPESRNLLANAKGVLIFPRVLGGGFIVGAEHGQGVLRVGGENQGYYSTTSGSIGFQAGAQSKAIIFVFNTQQALDSFLSSNGWTAGVDATVAVANLSATGAADLNTLNEPIVGFVMTNAGLMAGVSLEGTRVSRLNDQGQPINNAQ